MNILVKEVVSKSDLKKFIDFPHDLYKSDANYVPQLTIAAKEVLDRKKNAFFQHSQAAYFLAFDQGNIVGRIAAIINNNYNQYHKSNVAFFGFFDCINDVKVASALLDKAQDWLSTYNVDAILGPTNLTTNDTSGVLIEGYDRPPVVEMTYNYPYYKELIEQCGYGKEIDLYAYFIPTKGVNEKALNLSHRIKERLESKGITFRHIEMNNFKKEVENIKGIYQRAWERNWGFVPPTEAEFSQLADGLKMIVNPDYVIIAEDQGKMIAFALALPDINEVLINVKKGRLFPTGIFKLLAGKNKVSKIRIILLGVVEEYRNKGIEGVFFANFIQVAKDKNLLGGEASWVLENNAQMVKAAEHLNGERYKTYRIYSKKVNS